MIDTQALQTEQNAFVDAPVASAHSLPMPLSASALQELRAKLLAPYRPYLSGNIMGFVAVVKCSDASLEHEALKKAFERLGLGVSSWVGVMLNASTDSCELLETTSQSGAHVAPLQPQQFLRLLETIDPLLVILLDECSRNVLNKAWQAYDSSERDRNQVSVITSTKIPKIEAWTMTRILGRTFVSLEDFSSVLNDAGAENPSAKNQKQLAWQMLKQAVKLIC